MNINYIYKIENMDTLKETVNGCSNVVINVYFKVEAFDIDTGASCFYKNNANLSVPKSNINFIPFNNLTEENVITFVKESLGNTAIDTIEESLASVLNSKHYQGLPWN